MLLIVLVIGFLLIVELLQVSPTGGSVSTHRRKSSAEYQRAPSTFDCA